MGDIPALGLPAPGGYKQVVCPDVRMPPGMPSRAREPRLPLRAAMANATGLAQHRGQHAPVPTQLPNKDPHCQAPEITEDGEARLVVFFEEGRGKEKPQTDPTVLTHTQPSPQDQAKIIIKQKCLLGHKHITVSEGRGVVISTLRRNI